MNIVALREAKARLTAVGQQAQHGGRALITRRGKPFLVVVGVEGEELLDVLIQWDPAFWRDLQRRRARSRRKSFATEDIERELGSVGAQRSTKRTARAKHRS